MGLPSFAFCRFILNSKSKKLNTAKRKSFRPTFGCLLVKYPTIFLRKAFIVTYYIFVNKSWGVKRIGSCLTCLCFRRLWCDNRDDELKTQSQTSQANGFAPVWVFKWASSWSLRLKPLEQTVKRQKKVSRQLTPALCSNVKGTVDR